MKLIAWQYKRLKNANELYMRPVTERRVCDEPTTQGSRIITVSTRGLLIQAVSGRAVVKVLISNGEKEHGGTAKSLRGGISVAVANPRRRCRASVFRSCP